MFASFFVFLAFFIPNFYIVSFSELVAGAGTDLSLYIISITLAASFFSRVVPSYLADIIGPAPTLIVSAISSGALMFGWIGVKSVESTGKAALAL